MTCPGLQTPGIRLYGEIRQVLFSLLWNGWSLSSQLRVFLWKSKTYQCLEDVLMIHMVASIPRKRSEALVIFWQQPHITGAAATGTSPCFPCGVAGQRLWGRQACLQSCRLTSSVTWANHWISCVSFRNYKAVHQGVLVKICKSTGTVCDACCVAHTAGFLFSFLAKRTLRLSEWRCGCARGLVMIVSKPLWQPHCLSLRLTGLGAWNPVLANDMLGAAFWGPQERLSTLKGQSDEEKCSLWCSHFMWQQLTGQGRIEIYNQGWGRELWRGAGAPHCGVPWLPFAVSE